MARPVLLLASLLCAVLLPAATLALFDDEDSVTLFTEDDFEEQVLKGEKHWVIAFVAPWCGHCKNLAPHVKKAAIELKGDKAVGIGAVDCDQEKGLAAKYGVKGFPTIKTFSPGEEPQPYQGARDLDGLVEAARKLSGTKGGPSKFNSKLGPTLEYADMYNFLHARHPTSGNAKLSVLLLSADEAKKRSPGWFTTAAQEFKEGKKKSVSFGYVHAPVALQVAKRFGIAEDELPAVVVATVPRSKGKAKSKRAKGAYVQYDGDLEESSTVKKRTALMDYVKQMQKDVADNDAQEELEDRLELTPGFPQPKRPRKQRKVEIFHLNEDNLDQKCYKASDKRGPKMCVILFAEVDGEEGDHSAEFRQRETYLRLMKKYRNDPLSFTFVDVENQAAFAEEFGVTSEFGLVALKTGKRPRFAGFTDDRFTMHTGANFLDKLLGGDLRFTRFKDKQLPELKAGWEKLLDEDEDKPKPKAKAKARKVVDEEDEVIDLD